MEVSRIFDLLDQYQNKYRPKSDVLAGKENGEWVKYDLKTYREMADNISFGLMQLGVKKGDKIATISNNRPEWNFLDMGIAQVGGIHVPVYPTISEEDYRYILNHAEVKYLFVAGKELLRKIKHILPEIKSIVDVYTFRHIDGYKQLSDLIELGKTNQAREKLEEIKASIDKDDVVTLIYTSGTTGFPKGVMLSHDNLLSNVKATYFIFPVDETSRGLSYLPLCHVYERMVNYVLQYKGVSIYYAAQIPVLEGYGMTESSPVIAVNTFNKGEHKIGTVGPPLKNVEVKISETGEILVQGPLVMKGYFKEAEMTAEAIVDGWLHTGDVGVLEDGLLKITGRVKEIFKTSMGKYISPVLLENKIKESPFIDQIMVVGENRKFAAALLVPDFEHLQSWCKIKNIAYTTGREMINHKEVKARYKKEINCFNKQFGDTEKIKKWTLIDHEWTIDSGEITANLKVKRRYIHKKYEEVIAGLFA